MKTIGKSKEKKNVKGFRALNTKESSQIKGGEGTPTLRDGIIR